MKTNEELLYRIPLEETRPWPAFRNRFFAIILSGTVLMFSGFGAVTLKDYWPQAAYVLNVYAKIAPSVSFILLFVVLPWYCLRAKCPKCGHRLEAKQWTTDSKGVVYPCKTCRIGWSTGMLPYAGGD